MHLWEFFMNKTQPFCSIVVLNYFGEKVIGNTLDSLLKLNYPIDKFEIIIVDNNSQDKSKEIILDYSEKEKNIKYLFLDKNKGFAGGNNEGIRIARGDYVVLLNNDCIVEEDWLKELVKIAQRDPKIFAVSSKIKLYPMYYDLKFNYSNDLFLIDAYLSDSFVSNFEQSKKINLNIINKGEYYHSEIPYATTDRIISIVMRFEKNQRSLFSLKEALFNIISNEGVIDKPKITINENKITFTVKFNVKKFKNNNVHERVQNAGIVVFQDGSGRDIGAKIIEQRQYYEYDCGQFSKEQEVYAACGAAVLYSKKILDKIGFLEELFFMYYEDVEISERARLRGYKVLYCPKAEVRHLHAFSSKEWSNFFIYQAEKGRLLHLFFMFPLHIFIKEYITMIFRVGEVGMRILKGLSDRRRVIKFFKNIIFYAYMNSEKDVSSKTDFGKVIQFIKVIFYFPFNLPLLMVKKYIKHMYISEKAVRDNYLNILKGKWYFNS